MVVVKWKSVERRCEGDQEQRTDTINPIGKMQRTARRQMGGLSLDKLRLRLSSSRPPSGVQQIPVGASAHRNGEALDLTRAFTSKPAA